MANDAPILKLPEDQRVVSIVVSAGHSYWVKAGDPPMQHIARSVDRAELVAERGIRGDRYFNKRPGHRGQVTFMSFEAVADIRREFELPYLPVTAFRRNFIVSNIHLPDLIGRRFSIQGVEFEGTQECKPCRWMDVAVASGAWKFMQSQFRGGLRAAILCDGVIHRDVSSYTE